MPKYKVETWVDVYSILTDVFGLPSEVALSDLPFDSVMQMALNKSSYQNWHNLAQQKALEEGGNK